MAIDWETVQNDFITSNLTQSDIARKYNISRVTVSRHATAENWKEAKEKYRAEHMERHRAGLAEKERPKNLKSDGKDKSDEKSDILRASMESIYLPPIDIDDPIQVENRIIEYFEFCIKEDQPPEKAGMASWIGVTKKTLERWERGESRANTHREITERAVNRLESYIVKLLLKGKMMPASGIFILKNQHGYRDVVDIAQVPPPPLGELQSQEELEKRILGTVIDAEFEEVKADEAEKKGMET